ncbi:MAG: peptidoglycan DD-metalloendopeptidase family protein [Pseudomonadota bacterium]
MQKKWQIPSYYRVKKGDTLYSIAFRYQQDFLDLARRNAIQKPYIIHPEQIVRIQPYPRVKQAKNQPASVIVHHNKIESVKPNTTKTPSSKPTLSQNSKNSQKSPTLASPPPQKPKITNTVSSTVTTKKPPTWSKNDKKSVTKWVWPVKGSIIEGFSSNRQKSNGIDIAGKKGTPIRAAAGGRVVYSGNGLRGYGNLVIIKHSDDLLSAYAHNSKVQVQENELVNVGQIIAEMGDTGTNRIKLHFEIRKRGRPVDPLNFLPKT